MSKSRIVVVVISLLFLAWFIHFIRSASTASALHTLDESDPRITLRWAHSKVIFATVSRTDSWRALRPHLNNSTSLHQLSINFCELGRDDFEAIAKLPSLKKLFIRKSTFTPKDIDSLFPLKQLRLLQVSMCMLRNTDLKYFHGFHQIRRLHLQANEITSIGELAKLGLTNVEYLELGLNPIDDDGFKPIQAMSHLICVNILDTKVTVEGCKLAAPLLGLAGLNGPNMSKEERWQVKLAFDQERVEAVKRGEPILPASHYPFAGFELGGFINDSIIERLRRELGSVPGIEEANANGAKRPIPPPDYGR